MIMMRQIGNSILLGNPKADHQIIPMKTMIIRKILLQLDQQKENKRR